MTEHAHAAGSATSAGILFQSRVAAWFAARVLVEVPPAPDLPSLGSYVRCETEQPVDDVLVGLQNGGAIYVQVKRSVTARAAHDSALGSAFAQFVRQYVACRDAPPGSLPWERPLDPTRDRLLLAVGPRSTKTITQGIIQVLARLRGAPPEQPVSSLLRSQSDRGTWRILRSHIVAAWQEVESREPSDPEILRFLQVVRIQVLDVDDGGTDELLAQDLLASVVRERTHAATAWQRLIAECTRLAADRAGADASQLLISLAAIAKAPPSFEQDIRALRVFTVKALDRLEDLGRLRVGERYVKLERAAGPCLAEAASGSLLVIGEPGAGKSGALHDFAAAQLRRGADVVVLPADGVTATTDSNVKADLGILKDLDDVLAHWPGTQPAFLVIDALDAVRGTAGSRFLRELIARVRSRCQRWRVIASIRKFDARYSPELHELFRGPPPNREYSDPDPSLRTIRHFSVPGFTDAELDDLAGKSPEIAALLRLSNPHLRGLLRTPFNLRIACELISNGSGLTEFAAVTTGVDLLERYWTLRVLRPPLADLREIVLATACKRMLETRQLRVERSALADKGHAVLDELLSTHVLAEWQPAPSAPAERYSVTFSHHVLFDYAASRLVLGHDPANAIKLLQDDPELALAARPSVAMFFRRLWFGSPGREVFWAATLQFEAADLPVLAKLIAPTVAADLARQVRDLAPLLEELTRVRGENGPAVRTLGHVVGGMLDLQAADAEAGMGPETWADVMDQATAHCTRAVAYAVRPLLVQLTKSRDLSDSAALGRVSRRLLAFAWSQTPRDRSFVGHAITCVAATFGSSPSDSAEILRRALSPEHKKAFGHEELFWLAQEVEFLAPRDPLLVRDLYVSAFTYRQDSREETSIGDSQILSLKSTKTQDYDLALYRLAESFRSFLESSPVVATTALVTALDFYVRSERHGGVEGVRERHFEIEGAPARIRNDYSEIWDSSDTYQHDYPIKLLSTFDEYVQELAHDEARRADLQLVLNVIARENSWAVLWRRILLWGKKFPDSIGTQFRSLLWTNCILTGTDTTYAAGELLKVLFQSLSPEDRARVESAIVRLPESMPAERKEGGEYLRERLLGCLADDALVTADAQKLKISLSATNALPPNRPFSTRTRATWRAYGPREYLAEAGVPVDEPQNARVQALDDAVSQFSSKYLNEQPGGDAVAELMPQLATLRVALQSAEADRVHPKQAEHAYTSLVAAVARACATEHLAEAPDIARDLKSLLLEAANSQFPEIRDEDADWSSPGWSPAPRIDAAAGIMDMACEPALYDASLRDAVSKLSRDPVPAVRFQIAQRLVRLLQVDPELFRELTTQFIQHEPTAGVLVGAIGGGLDPLARTNPSAAVSLAAGLLERLRATPKDKVKDALEHCLTVLMMLDVWRNDLQARAVVDATLSKLPETGAEVLSVLGHLRETLTEGLGVRTGPASGAADAARQRVVAIYSHALRRATAFLKTLTSPMEPNDPAYEPARNCALIVDSVAHEVYFAAGGASDGQQALTPEGLRRLYQDCEPVLDLLSEAGVPSATHSLLEALELFIPVDPARVFLRISRAAVASQSSGYQFESLAVDLAVKLVQRFIADYLGILRGSAETRTALLEILEVFAKVGWPSARQLTFRLQEIYR